MLEVQLHVPDGLEPERVIQVVEQACASHHLHCARKGTLVSYPGSVHWHFKQGREKGTLEITWWGREHRLWFKVAKGRKSPWIDENLPRLKEQIEKSLL